jgi:hypothetical protein
MLFVHIFTGGRVMQIYSSMILAANAWSIVEDIHNF